MDLVYLTQFEGSLRNRSTWLVDLAVVKLLVVGSILIVFMKIFTQLLRH